MENTEKIPAFTKKQCPLASIHPAQENSDCLGESCACYVKIYKPKPIAVFGREFADPEHYLKFEGCGLLNTIPWQHVEYPKEQKNAEAHQ